MTPTAPDGAEVERVAPLPGQKWTPTRPTRTVLAVEDDRLAGPVVRYVDEIGENMCSLSNWHKWVAWHAASLEPAALAAMQPRDGGWEAIETAPRDGTRILVWDGDSAAVAAWFLADGWYVLEAGWFYADSLSGEVPIYGVSDDVVSIDPTHWRWPPDPPPPVPAAAPSADGPEGGAA